MLVRRELCKRQDRGQELGGDLGPALCMKLVGPREEASAEHWRASDTVGGVGQASVYDTTYTKATYRGPYLCPRNVGSQEQLGPQFPGLCAAGVLGQGTLSSWRGVLSYTLRCKFSTSDLALS